MKPTSYNPSPLEVDFAKAIVDLKQEIIAKLTGMELEELETSYERDNPMVLFKLCENDGTKHEIVIKFIQRVLD